jgi:CubicO group peptidase (beta-lactamase class C family)
VAANVRILFLASAALAVLVLGACNRTPKEQLVVEAPPELGDIRSQLLDKIEADEIPSMAVAVARGGEIIWMEGLGWADKESSQAASPDTIYAIGSTSKSLTATLAMALSEQGKFDINKGVDAYLDEAELSYLSGEGRFPTIRELLTMTGGVPHGGGVTGWPEYTLTRQDMSRRAELVAYPPGTLYEYSNYSIGLAMRAMEAATGQSYDELMWQFVFEPLGMNDSWVSYRAHNEQQATLYDPDVSPIDYYRFYPEAAGGFYSSVADLMRFALFHAGYLEPEDTVISRENLEFMHTARPSEVPGSLSALGFGSLDMPTTGVMQLVSNGNVQGGNSHLSILKPTGDIVITALNMTSRDSFADSTALEIAEVLRPGIEEDFGNLVASYRQKSEQPFTGDPAWTGRWQGTLEGEGVLVQIDLLIAEDGDIDIALDNGEAASVGNIRFPHGTVVGQVDGLLDSTSRTIRLSLHDGVLYGHIIVRATDGDTRGNYPYRMKLTAVD